MQSPSLGLHVGAQVRPMHKHLQDLVFMGTLIKNEGKTKFKQLFQCSWNTLACWSSPHGGTSVAPCTQLLLVDHPMYAWGTPGWPCPWGMDTGHRVTPHICCSSHCSAMVSVWKNLPPGSQKPISQCKWRRGCCKKKEILNSTTFRQAVDKTNRIVREEKKSQNSQQTKHVKYVCVYF